MDIRFMILILAYFYGFCENSSPSSSSSNDDSASGSYLLDILKSKVTYHNKDPRVDYVLPEMIFSSSARRLSGNEIKISDSVGFLGSGKYGGVYQGRSRKDNSFWAVKLVPIFSSYRLKCAINELIIASSRGIMENPSLVPIVESYLYHGDLFTVMPLVDGSPLNRISWTVFGRIPDDILRLIYQILMSVQSIGEKRICHADISSSNFTISRNGSVFLIDFGLSQQMISRFSNTEDTDFMYTEICHDHKNVANLCLSIIKRTKLANHENAFPFIPNLSSYFSLLQKDKIQINEILHSPIFNEIRESPLLKCNYTQIFHL